MGARQRLTLGAGLLVGAWALMLVVTSYLVAHDHTPGAVAVAASAMYVVGGVVCHQQPTRSFHPWGTQMPVCARCSGLYASAPFGIIVALGSGWRRAHRARSARCDRTNWSTRVLRFVLLVTAVPTLMTVGVELMGLIHPTNMARAVLALPLGFSVTWVASLALCSAIDEAC